MTTTERAPDTLGGMRRDAESGHYRVLPGYGHYANRFRIHETWLDEDDNLWIDGSAVEKALQDGGPAIFEVAATPQHPAHDAA